MHISMSDSAASCRSASPKVAGMGARDKSVGCVHVLAGHVRNGIVESVEPQAESEYSRWKIVELFGSQEWDQRLVVSFNGNPFADNVACKFLASPSRSQRLLFYLRIVTFSLAGACPAGGSGGWSTPLSLAYHYTVY